MTVGSLLFWLLQNPHFHAQIPCLIFAVKRGLLITEAHMMRVLPPLEKYRGGTTSARRRKCWNLSHAHIWADFTLTWQNFFIRNVGVALILQYHSGADTFGSASKVL